MDLERRVERGLFLTTERSGETPGADFEGSKSSRGEDIAQSPNQQEMGELDQIRGDIKLESLSSAFEFLQNSCLSDEETEYGFQTIEAVKFLRENEETRRSFLLGFGLEGINNVYEDPKHEQHEALERYDVLKGLVLWAQTKAQLSREYEDVSSESKEDFLRGIALTEERILNAYKGFFLREVTFDMGKQTKVPSAFLIHNRQGGEKEWFGDINTTFPALGGSVKRSLPENKLYEAVQSAERNEIFKTLPPFVVAKKVVEASSNDKDQKVFERLQEDYNGNVIQLVAAVPIHISDIFKSKKPFAEFDARTGETVRFLAEVYGVENFGLGASLTAGTRKGMGLRDIVKDLNESLDIDIKITTGHANTIYSMYKIADEAIKKTEMDISKENLGIIGCGYIGEAVLEMMLLKLNDDKKLPESIYLSDIEITKAQSLKGKIEDFIKAKKINFKGKIYVTEENQVVANQARLIFGSASSKEPEEIALIPGTIFIDDSQPPIAQPNQQEDSKILMLQPILSLPDNIKRLFVDTNEPYSYSPTAMTPESEFTCGIEVLAATAKRILSSGNDASYFNQKKVTLELANTIGALVEDLGIVPKLEYWGENVRNKVASVKNVLKEGGNVSKPVYIFMDIASTEKIGLSRMFNYLYFKVEPLFVSKFRSKAKQYLLLRKLNSASHGSAA